MPPAPFGPHPILMTRWSLLNWLIWVCPLDPPKQLPLDPPSDLTLDPPSDRILDLPLESPLDLHQIHLRVQACVVLTHLDLPLDLPPNLPPQSTPSICPWSGANSGRLHRACAAARQPRDLSRPSLSSRRVCVGDMHARRAMFHFALYLQTAPLYGLGERQVFMQERAPLRQSWILPESHVLAGSVQPRSGAFGHIQCPALLHSHQKCTYMVLRFLSTESDSKQSDSSLKRN